MKEATYSRLTKISVAIIAVILVMVPFHAFLTVWLSSLTGHYTAWRLWDELLLLVGSLLALPLLIKFWPKITKQHLLWLMIGYAALMFIIGGVALAKHDVTAKAFGYGIIVDLRFFLFFWLCLVVASYSDWLKKHWQPLLLIPAAVVVAFGLVQLLLPYNFLSHFGYGPRTIFPYETVNSNLHYIRIMSTLRGSNLLGAYLVVIVAALSALFIRAKTAKWRWLYGIFSLATIAALFFTYSRSAWLGAAVAGVVVAALGIRSAKIRRTGAIALAAIVLAGGVAILSFHNNPRVQNILTHTQQNSSIKTTSDQNHTSALSAGLHDVVRQPFGAGPGTAGPASVYNNGRVRIAENYYIQIVQEVGWLGLVIFLMVTWLVRQSLWSASSDAFDLCLAASLLGIFFVGLFSHVWVDDTLSYIWWGLAGIALAPKLIKKV